MKTPDFTPDTYSMKMELSRQQQEIQRLQGDIKKITAERDAMVRQEVRHLTERAEAAERRLGEANQALAAMFWLFDADGSEYPKACKAANKRDTEQQIKALEWLMQNRTTDLNIDIGHIEVVLPDKIEQRIEQLRKEGE